MTEPTTLTLASFVYRNASRDFPLKEFCLPATAENLCDSSSSLIPTEDEPQVLLNQARRQHDLVLHISLIFEAVAAKIQGFVIQVTESAEQTHTIFPDMETTRRKIMLGFGRGSGPNQGNSTKM